MKLRNHLWKHLAVIALIILLCTILSRILFSSETLSDYAKQHPAANTPFEETVWETDDRSATQEETLTEDERISTEEEMDSGEELTVQVDGNFEDEFANTEFRYTLTDGFFYEPLPIFIQEKIRGVSFPENDAQINIEDLSYLNVQYNDFSGDTAVGEIICHYSIAFDLLEIFEQLYRSGYQFERICLIDEYGGDDTLSMEHNNTSCFNYRVVDGSSKLSKHAYGLAIDINPYYNPYVVFNKDGTGETYISPSGSEAYADRSKEFPYKIDEDDLCYKLFIEHGFTWGGNWNSCKDYQHFQK